MIESDDNGLFTIQQVADITGLSKQVIRKWEERYGFVQPKRLDNGYRIYSQQDVKKLLQIKLLSEQGHSLKQAALLAKEIDEDIEIPVQMEKLPYNEQWNEYIFMLLEKGSRCDEIELNLTLQQAHHQLGLESFLTNIVVPFLKEVGKRWENREWDEYQESVSSLVVRDFLVQIRRNYPYRENAPFVLGACLPYEHHEVPLHLILLRFMMKGWKTQLIGASPAPGAIESLADRLKPDIVLLSATTTIPFETDSELLQRLDEFAQKQANMAFYLGGQGGITYSPDYKLRAIIVTNSIEDILK
ncbi:MerR family transcriptional regulator [Niallia endozanthoxylica]|uniref:MerR family transcriptional regulator n=1 Tax=Niallia endozanthoxylica TaxID=2036016 RepID=A0A5J5H4C5_9BACI|nr:MerR family transcriptional regulator [Niallia endozanthoxylica]KAA9014552.1 MerR family transcriptional regulator [Niallia endozanthoxylica]